MGYMGYWARNSRSVAETPFGTLRLSSGFSTCSEDDFIASKTTGELVGANDEVIGRCTFAAFRTKRNRTWMGVGAIGYWMDSIDQDALEIFEAVSEADEMDLEYYFNQSCLLVAQRIELEPSARGQGAWKALYFATMEKALEATRRRPEEFFFKVFPLVFEGNVTEENSAQFAESLRALKLLYAVHLGATPLELPASFGCYMRAPVPDQVQEGH